MVTEIRSASERARAIQSGGIQQMIDLLDEGRSATPDPERITKATAESLAGGILIQIYTAVGEGRLGPESELVPQLMYAAVLPYLGPESAAEELEIPPPPRSPETEAARAYNLVPCPQEGMAKARTEATSARFPAVITAFPAEQVAESQRERLLAAVATLVAERGYAGTTITEIAKTASVSNRVFYKNFVDKKEAFIAAFDAVAVHLRGADRRRRRGCRRGLVGPADRRPAHRPSTFFDSEPELARLCLVAPFTATPEIAAHLREAIAGAVPYLARGRGLHDGDSELPDSTEDSLIGGVIGQLSRSLLTESGPLIDLLPDLVEFGLSPYLGTDAARRLGAEAA